MTHALVDNGKIIAYPYSVWELKKDNPHISFPENMDNDLLAEFNVHPVIAEPMPHYDARFQRVVEEKPVSDNGVWKTSYRVEALSEQEVSEARLEAAAALRLERDHRLYSCDWTMLADAPISAAKRLEWAAYRNALRDLPEKTEDIFNPNWPVPPESK